MMNDVGVAAERHETVTWRRIAASDPELSHQSRYIKVHRTQVVRLPLPPQATTYVDHPPPSTCCDGKAGSQGQGNIHHLHAISVICNLQPAPQPSILNPPSANRPYPHLPTAWKISFLSYLQLSSLSFSFTTYRKPQNSLPLTLCAHSQSSHPPLVIFRLGCQTRLPTPPSLQKSDIMPEDTHLPTSFDHKDQAAISADRSATSPVHAAAPSDAASNATDNAPNISTLGQDDAAAAGDAIVSPVGNPAAPPTSFGQNPQLMKQVDSVLASEVSILHGANNPP